MQPLSYLALAVAFMLAPFPGQAEQHVWYSSFEEDFDPSAGTRNVGAGRAAASGVLQGFWLETADGGGPADLENFHIGPVTKRATWDQPLCILINTSDFAYEGELRSEPERVGDSFKLRAINSSYSERLKETYDEASVLLLAVMSDRCAPLKDTVLVPVSMSDQPDTLTVLLALRSGEAFANLVPASGDEPVKMKCRDHKTNVSNVRCRVDLTKLNAGSHDLRIRIAGRGDDVTLTWKTAF